eukprot:6102446-Pleurochrysis_carterae.AAC.1
MASVVSECVAITTASNLWLSTADSLRPCVPPAAAFFLSFLPSAGLARAVVSVTVPSALRVSDVTRVDVRTCGIQSRISVWCETRVGGGEKSA